MRKSFLGLAALIFMLPACASVPHDDSANDPLESVNRTIFDFNDILDRAVFRPTAYVYRQVPEVVRMPARNVVDNLGEPITFANEILQFEIARAGNTLMRFVVNSSIGFLGLADIATDMGFPSHEEDFGQTLAVWGVGEGMYLVAPVFGPGNVRDFVGRAIDGFADPFTNWWNNADHEEIIVARAAVDAIDKRERVLDILDEIREGSIDYYATIRSLYNQRRAALVRNDNTDGTADTLWDAFDEEDEDEE